MKAGISRAIVLLTLLSFASASASGQGAPAERSIPRLEKRGETTQLIVDGKPFLVLGGELLNSSGSSVAYMKPVWPRLAAMNLNTVLVPVSWELIEPQESKWDFEVVDGLIRDARQHQLRLILLWFGSWKNTYSSYTPAWVKKDVERFPRVQLHDGRGTERLSPFHAANWEADARAFAALMRHLKQVDGDMRTVIMMQVENEVGVIPESRDHSTIAGSRFAGPVAPELLNYLSRNRASLVPELRGAWEAAGARAAGTWEEVFGKQPLTDDLFMAWHFAAYVQRVAAAGKREYPLPMFVNAALIRPNYQPGQYNSGGPLPHSMDLWRAAAPAIDFVTPDIYFENFADWCRLYQRLGNPLFIPEARAGAAAAANVLYAVGAHAAIGFSPFAIDEEGAAGSSERRTADENRELLAASYGVLSRLAPLVLEKQASGDIAATLLEGEAQRSARFSLGGYTMTMTRAAAAAPNASAERAAALFVRTGEDEFLVAGSGRANISFAPNSPGLPIAGIASIDEERLVDGHWVRLRRLNGDENGQGQVLRLNPSGATPGTAYRVRLYRYR